VRIPEIVLGFLLATALLALLCALSLPNTLVIWLAGATLVLGAVYIAFHNVARVVSWFRDAHRVTALSTLALAFGTIALAYLSFQQIQIMKDDQRPWVGLGNIRPIAENPNSTIVVAYYIDVKNTGKSPALNADVRFIGAPGDCSKFSIPKQRCKGDECDFRGVELLPGSTAGTRIPRAWEVARTPLVDAV
jgi:hypothetical protein